MIGGTAGSDDTVSNSSLVGLKGQINGQSLPSRMTTTQRDLSHRRSGMVIFKYKPMWSFSVTMALFGMIFSRGFMTLQEQLYLNYISLKKDRTAFENSRMMLALSVIANHSLKKQNWGRTNKIEAENIIVNLINELKFTASRNKNTLLMAVHVFWRLQSAEENLLLEKSQSLSRLIPNCLIDWISPSLGARLSLYRLNLSFGISLNLENQQLFPS